MLEGLFAMLETTNLSADFTVGVIEKWSVAIFYSTGAWCSDDHLNSSKHRTDDRQNHERDNLKHSRFDKYSKQTAARMYDSDNYRQACTKRSHAAIVFIQ